MRSCLKRPWNFGPFDDAQSGDEQPCKACSQCGGEMILQRAADRPSWRDVMASNHRPWWYGDPAKVRNLAPAVPSR